MQGRVGRGEHPCRPGAHIWWNWTHAIKVHIQTYGKCNIDEHHWPLCVWLKWNRKAIKRVLLKATCCSCSQLQTANGAIKVCRRVNFVLNIYYQCTFIRMEHAKLNATVCVQLIWNRTGMKRVLLKATCSSYSWLQTANGALKVCRRRVNLVFNVMLSGSVCMQRDFKKSLSATANKPHLVHLSNLSKTATWGCNLNVVSCNVINSRCLGYARAALHILDGFGLHPNGRANS